ncbi:hypothetical protein ANN_06675 [Periplaneta americana]|uniref:Uncharacterized protein n=1 Tax=Periplaneta americana TaxID=6978 RepID=A0ABQ8TF23_PERAM|nr:hypothetical protein ANN_06675 [Periplaneta americana]
MGESRNAYRVLVGRPEGKRPLGRPRRRWEDNIKMDLREVGYDDRDWINLAQDRDRWRAYVRAAMNLRVEVHSSSSGAGSDENLSSSDLSERSADPENDYEEIYQSREEKPARRRSRDSGSHSRTGSTSSSSNGHQVVVTSAPPPAPQPPPQEEPSMTASTVLEKSFVAQLPYKSQKGGRPEDERPGSQEN